MAELDRQINTLREQMDMVASHLRDHQSRLIANDGLTEQMDLVLGTNSPPEQIVTRYFGPDQGKQAQGCDRRLRHRRGRGDALVVVSNAVACVRDTQWAELNCVPHGWRPL